MVCPFQVGDEVVCVDASHRNKQRSWSGQLVKGQIYIVDGVIKVPHPHPLEGEVTVTLLGEPHVCEKNGVEIGFSPDRFRKVTRPTTDIQAWLAQPIDKTKTRHLDKSKRKEKANG